MLSSVLKQREQCKDPHRGYVGCEVIVEEWRPKAEPTCACCPSPTPTQPRHRYDVTTGNK
ncbi:hypothetical protein RR48_02948 [Papilio machaon]|uniref:Uncharacterized protein n=1 Tax=Papilio machaon TaxID=76193 RepID=A0A0N1PFP7_PAPMA|nr:hypothetical protein RR48_02948 [Papilio machaon]